MLAGLTKAGSKGRLGARLREEPSLSRSSSTSSPSRGTIRAFADSIGATGAAGTSPRPSSASLHGPTMRFEQSPRTKTAEPSPSFGMASLHDRPASSSSTTKPPPPTAAPKWSMDGLTKDMAKTTVSKTEEPKPAASLQKIDAKPTDNWALKEVTNTLKKNASADSTPPHLRGKGAVSSTKPSSAAAQPEKAEPMKAPEVKPTSFAPAATNGFTFTMPKTAPSAPVAKKESKSGFDFVNSTAADFSSNLTPSIGSTPAMPPSPKLAHKAKGSMTMGSMPGSFFLEPTPTKASSSVHSAPAMQPVQEPVQEPAQPPAMSDGDDMTIIILQTIQREVTALKTKVHSVEAENFELLKRVTRLEEEAARRKYVGTNNAKIPYMIYVVYRKFIPQPLVPNVTKLTFYVAGGAKVERVQVDATMRIDELIGSARTKGDVSPRASPEPQIWFNGQALGHPLKLGEAGITQGVQVEFRYG